MRRTSLLAVFAVTVVCLMLAMAGNALALGFEAAASVWQQTPGGDFSYEGTKNELKDVFGYDEESQMGLRARIETPLMFPNIHLKYTPMSFSGTSKAPFTFKNTSYTANVSSELSMDHYDIGIYYGLPGLSAATMKTVNVDIGINVRMIEFDAKVKEPLPQSKSLSLGLPLVYLAAQIKPSDSFAIEAEVLGISMSGNHYYDYSARLKYFPVSPLFIAAGYRGEDIAIDEENVLADITFTGPFLEAGIQF